MDGIEKITARIRADADAELAQLREQTEAQILEIQAQAKAQMDQERTAILARGRRAAEERLERLKSAAQLERRKLELAAKQEVLSEAFEQALEKLCALPEEEYIQLLTGMVLQAVSTGREQLVFSPRDRSRIGKQVVVAAGEGGGPGAARLPDRLPGGGSAGQGGQQCRGADHRHWPALPGGGDPSHPGRLHPGGRTGGGQLLL